MHDGVLVGFKLITVPLSTAPKYEAISYCWGSTDSCTGILVSTQYHGKQVYRVTKNRATCLHSLLVAHQPEQDKPRYIWVDQVCINQEDVKERNAQVKRMAEIYKIASGVIVWLGQKSDFSLDEIDLVIHPDPHLEWRGKTVINWVLEWAVFARPWFFRLWVFQEAVFAQHISILLGPVLMHWEALTEVAASVREFTDEDVIRDLDHTYCIPSYLHDQMVAYIEFTSQRMAKEEYIDMDLLMWRLHAQKCQDPRDKLFSLVGFAGNILPIEFIDYDQPAAVIFQDCTRCLIERTGSLRAITYLNREVPEWRPSWVPLWHEQLKMGIETDLNKDLELPSASLHRRWKPLFPAVEDQLIVSGKAVDVVAAKVHSFKNSMDAFFIQKRFASVLREPFHEAWSLISHVHEEGGQQKLAEDIVPKIEREGVASASSPGHEPPSEFFTHFFRTVFLGQDLVESDFKHLIQTPKEDQTMARLEVLMKWGLHSTSMLIVLKSGRLGFVKEPGGEPKVGDFIAILHGLNVPCILRKTEDGEGWLYVADIHIVDIMHGEGEHEMSTSRLRLIFNQLWTGRKMKQIPSNSYEPEDHVRNCKEIN